VATSLEQALTQVRANTQAVDAAFKELSQTFQGLKRADVAAAFKEAEAAAKEAAKEAKAAAKEIEQAEKRLAEERRKQIRAVFEAASAGANLLRAPLNIFQTALSAIQTNVVGFVAKANPGAVMRFNLALDNMMAVLGKTMVPVLDKVTQLLTVVGGAFLGMNEQAKSLVAGLGAAAVGLVTFGAAVLVVQTVMTGGLMPVIAALAGAVGGFVFATQPVKDVMERVGNAFVWVANLLGGLVDTVFSGLAPVFSLFGAILDEFTPIATTAFNTIGNLLSAITGAWATGMIHVLETVTPYLLGFAKAMMEVAEAAYDSLRELLSFVGIDLPAFGAAPEGGVKDPAGQAVRSTGTSDVSAVLQRARESAFMSGLGGGKKDPAERGANAMEQMNAKAEEIRKEIMDFFHNFPTVVGQEFFKALERLAKILGLDLPEGVAPGAVGREAVQSIQRDFDEIMNNPIAVLSRGLNQSGKEFDSLRTGLTAAIFGS
jgi:hypothetical protein